MRRRATFLLVPVAALGFVASLAFGGRAHGDVLPTTLTLPTLSLRCHRRHRLLRRRNRPRRLHPRLHRNHRLRLPPAPQPPPPPAPPAAPPPPAPTATGTRPPVHRASSRTRSGGEGSPPGAQDSAAAPTRGSASVRAGGAPARASSRRTTTAGRIFQRAAVARVQAARAAPSRPPFLGLSRSSAAFGILATVFGAAFGLSLLVVAAGLVPPRALPRRVAVLVFDRRELLVYAGLATAFGLGLALAVALLG